MAEVPRIGLFSDSGATFVDVDGFTGRTVQETGEGTFIRFEGDAVPRGFRGSGLGSVWSIEAIFARYNTSGAMDLLTLFRDAFQAVDSRLILTPGGFMDEYFTTPVTVEVHSWGTAVKSVAGITTVSFTAQEVVS